jgi:hypothetical protein
MEEGFRLNTFSYLGMTAYALALVLVTVNAPDTAALFVQPHALLVMARGPILGVILALIAFKLCDGNALVSNLVLAFVLFFASAELCRDILRADGPHENSIAVEEAPPPYSRRNADDSSR